MTLSLPPNDEKYRCSSCALTGHKLWRDYGYADEFWCAACCRVKIVEAESKRKSDPWEQPHGPLDMMRYGFSAVAAVPTDDDYDGWRSAGAFESEHLLWWHALPTYVDQDDEIRTILAVMKDAVDDLDRSHRNCVRLTKDANWMLNRLAEPTMLVPINRFEGGYGYKRDLESVRAVCLDILTAQFEMQRHELGLYKTKSTLEWRLARKMVRVTAPVELTVWGYRTETIGKWTLTGGENQKITIEPGAKIASAGSRPRLLLEDGSEITIMEQELLGHYGQGSEYWLLDDLVDRGVARYIDGRY